MCLEAMRARITDRGRPKNRYPKRGRGCITCQCFYRYH